MDMDKLKYQYGRCANCGKEFTPELRDEYEITHCPWCGGIILDYYNDTNQLGQVKVDTNKFIYCEECGTRIYEHNYNYTGKGGKWINNGNSSSKMIRTSNGHDKWPGICSGPCKRNLCGRCADWDINGECELCRNSPCGQCPNHDVVEMCQECEHLTEREKWSGYKKPDPCDACGVHSEVGCRGCLEKLG
jgi:DNA-directed RNA polymerase subunit RPC12/RpoP